jgi:D-glycero-D-manno-heptose 1,7-bisphosphate phosphatase
MTRAVFLDRDGTLNRRPPEHDYLRSAREFVWLPGAREAVGRLRQARYVPLVVSNQRGVARGLVTLDALSEIDLRIQLELEPYGGAIRAFSYCLHDEADDCACRKPRPGLLTDLAAELDLDMAESWMIGDSESDVLAGQRAGCRTVLIASEPTDTAATIVAPSLAAATDLIVGAAHPEPVAL